jgi:Effector-associated domain 11/Caspase domain
MDNHALLIGIGQRADDSKAIAVTATDATRLAEELEKRCGYNANKIRALVGAKAGKTAILRELDSLIKKTTEQKANLVILFYSGHAVVRNGQFYLVSADVENDYLEDSALLGTKFLDKINLIQANAVLLLLNCCHAGAVGESVDIPFEKSAFISQPNRAILTACTKSEKAFVSTPLSVFTYSLLSGLAGECIKQEQKAKVTLFDLAMYVRENVAAISKGKQHPELSVLKEVATTNFEIVDYSKGIPPFPKEPRGGLYDALGKSLEPSSVTDSDYRKQYEWLGSMENVAIDSDLEAGGDIIFGGSQNPSNPKKSKKVAAGGNKIKNAAIKSTIKAGGNIEFGDKNGPKEQTSDIQNAAIGSRIKAGGNVIFGDIVTNNTIVSQEPHKTALPPLKAELQQWIAQGKIEAVFKRFQEAAKKYTLDCANELVGHAARYSQLKQKERMGTISYDNASREQNLINIALIELINDLEI